MSAKSLTDIITNVDWVLDASASVAVQGRLGDLLGSGKPSFSVFQVAAGRGTVLIYTPDLTVTEPNMVEAVLVTTLLNQPIMSAWFDESTDTVNLGGGCAAVTSKIPNSIVKFGAGWLADRMLRLLDSNERRSTAFAELLNYDPNNGTTQVYRVDVENPSLTRTRTWRVFVPPHVATRLGEYAERALPNETGGVLIGRLDRQRQVVYVTDVWKSPDDSYATRTGFSRGLAGLENRIAMMEKDTNEYLHYVGEWHSHPPSAGTALSSVDSATARRMAKELEDDRIPAVCLITDTKTCSSHIVENR